MPDIFETIRDTLNATKNGKSDPGLSTEMADDVRLLLDNQREILACMATIARGGQLPISIARDLQERAKKISKILEG